MALSPPKKGTPTKQAQTQKRSQGDSYFDEFFQSPESHQMDTGSDPEQQRQWISDHLMWETTLGLREDDTINRVITPEDTKQQPVADNTRQPPAARRQLSEQERELLRTQVTEPTATQPVPATPAQYQGAPGSRQQSYANQRTTAARAAQRTSGQAASRQPVTAQRAPQVQRPPQSTRSYTGTRPVTKPVSQKMAGSPNTATASKAPVTQGPRPATRPGTNKPPPVSTQVGNPHHKPNAEAPRRNPLHQQTQPVSRGIGDTERVLDLDSRPDRKHFHWAKIIAAGLSIALVSFIGGYHFGRKNADEAHMAFILETMKNAKLKETVAKNPVKRSSSRHKAIKSKPKRKPAARHVAAETESRSHPKMGTEEVASRQTNSDAVFEGKEIAVTSANGNNGEQTGDIPQPGNPTNIAGNTTSRNWNGAPGQIQGSAQGNAATNSTDLQSTSMANSGPAQSGSPPENSAKPPQNRQKEIRQLLKQSLQAFNNKQWETLVDLSNKVLALNPKVINALTNRSAAYTEMNLFGPALQDSNTAIQIDPNNALAINNRGYVYEKMGDIQNATSDYQTACSLGEKLSCKEVTRLTKQ